MKLNHTVTLILVVYFLSLFQAVLCPSFSIAQVRFENPKVFNTMDGLPSDKITCITKDYTGFIWIGTDKGLSRYDGAHVENFFHDEKDEFSIKNNQIIDVLADEKNNKIWVAHASGLSAYDPDKKMFDNYYHDAVNPNSVPAYRAYKIFQDNKGHIWVGFQAGGILKYRPETNDFERFLCFDETTQSFPDICDYGVGNISQDIEDENIFWLGTHFGLIEFNQQTGDFEVFIYDFEDTKLENYINSLRCIHAHPNGKIYLGTYYEGITVFDRTTKTYSRLDPCYNDNNSPFIKDITDNFNPTNSGKFWISSQKGLQLYNPKTNCIEQTFKNSKSKTYGIDLIDEEGRFWDATTASGLLLYNPLFQQTKTIDYINLKSEYNPIISKILEDTNRNELLIAAEDAAGLYILDQKNGTVSIIPPPDEYDMEEYGGFQAQDMIFMDNGGLLIVEEANLFWYKPGFQKLKRYPINFPVTAPRLRGIIKDQNGDYWVSSFILGLYKLNLKTNDYYSFESRINKIRSRLGGDFLAEDSKGNIWLREHNGILIYDKENDDFIYHPHDLKKMNSFRGMGAITADQDGNIWIASRKEFLGYAHTDSLSSGVLHFYGKTDGLKGEHVSQIVLYKNKLFVFSDFGLQVFNPATRQFEAHYDAAFGIGSSITSATLLSNGYMAVGKNRTISFFHPDSLKMNTEQPEPYIANFRVFDQRWRLKSNPNAIDTIHLSYKQNFFSFEISSVAYNQPENINIRYKLDGFNESWQDGTKHKLASYTNVPGGEYRFMIETIDDQGNTVGIPSISYLIISTVWWKTIWFWGLAIIFLAGIAYLLYRWRIKQVRKEEQVKTVYERQLADVKMSALRAQMNPHFIFNSLNSIEYYIINNESDKAVDYLGRFSRLIRLILQNSKSSNVPLKDELEALKIYMEMESLRFNNLFEYEVKMEAGVAMDDIKVPPMIIQPYVENAIWHGLMQKKGEKGRIELKMHRNNGALICFIEDNGIGREAAGQLKSKSASKRKSYGMKITSDRLSALNKLSKSAASVQVFDLKKDDGSAAGTRVELVIPVITNDDE